MMRFGSVCSGIEAASVAWARLGWDPIFYSEIEPFPCAVLAHHHPSVPNLGDMTRFKEWPDHAIDLLVGGTPCQSFSVAGLRKGLDDPRGNLMLTYLAIARRYRPRWLVWENVPGVLSSSKGRDFSTFIRGLEELGYHAAWRVLDAQYVRVDGHPRAVPQRRRRVFVVGYLGDWRRAAAVLFEPEGLRGDPAPRREAGKGAAPTIAARTRGGGGLGTDFDCDGGLIVDDAARCDTAGYAQRLDWETENFVATREVAGALTGNYGKQPDNSDTGLGPNLVAHALRGEGFDASEDGTGRGTPLVPVPAEVAGTLKACAKSGGWSNSVDHAAAGMMVPTIAFDCKAGGNTSFSVGEVPGALRGEGHGGGHAAVATGWAVRRLTPTECERLMGFPDGYTAIPWRGKPAEQCPDGPRYKALGNSMAVNVMRWIGMRIQAVESICFQARAA